jgi:hypothetical protein
MEFKTTVLKAQYQNDIEPTLRNLIEGLDNYCIESSIPELIITELIRSPRHQSDEHAVGRAVDVRAHVETECQCAVHKTTHPLYRYNPEQLEQMRQWVETHFPRKPWYNKVGQSLSGFYPHGRGAVFHIHISVDK